MCVITYLYSNSAYLCKQFIRSDDAISISQEAPYPSDKRKYFGCWLIG